MGILLRGSAENFNPQIMTEENSLAVKMDKSFAVRKKSIDLFQRYSRFTSFMYSTGRLNRGASSGKVLRAKHEIYDNAFRIQYDGALILPAYAYGSAVFGSIHDAGNQSPDMSGVVGVTYTNGKTVSTITTNTIGSFAVKHDPANNIWGNKFNPNDSVALGSGHGILLIFTGPGRMAADESHVVYNFKTAGPAAKFKIADLADGQVLLEGGNYFGQGSLRGYQRHTKNRWKINYSSIHRYGIVMTGSAKQQKAQWVYNSSDRSARMWEYTEILKGEEIFHMMNELSLRYSRITMDPSTHSWYENSGLNSLTINGFTTETGITAPMLGDGWVPQITDNAEFEYSINDGLSHLYVEAISMVLGQRSPKGSTGNTFIGVTDKIGAMVADKAYKKLLGWGNPGEPTANAVTHMAVSISTGQDHKLGFKVSRYDYLNNDIYILEDELLNHPSLFPTNGGVTGTGNIYFLNASDIDGVSNFEIIARTGRDFIKKNIDGMHSFDPQANSGNQAASGFDGCKVEMLCEQLPVLYDNRSCGVLKANDVYNGGSLAGSNWLTANPDATSFIY